MKKKKSHKFTITLLLIIFFLISGLLLYAFEIPIFPSEKEDNKNVTKADTTPPEIKCSVHALTLTKGETLSLDRLSLRITDKSKIGEPFLSKVSATNLNLSELTTEENPTQLATQFSKGIPLHDSDYTFLYGGTYELVISVKDEFENQGNYTLNITVEEPPQLTVFSNFYIAKGTSTDFKKYVTAWDFLDTQCSRETVHIDTSELNISAFGTYPITFTIKDTYGLSTSVTSSAIVCKPEEIQKLIYSHTISVSDSGIIGISNAYDVGYYKENDTAFNESLLLPSTLSIQQTDGTLEKGFLLAITDTHALICTLANKMSDSLTKTIIFFDGTTKRVPITAIDKDKNIAFLQIPISEEESLSSLTFEETKKLRTIHIDEAFWNNICSFLLTEHIPLSDILKLYESVYKNTNIILSEVS